jgi:hypothetical protein
MPPKPRRPRHEDRAWRPVGTLGNDAWQREADAAAWSAVSGMPPALYLGAIEPIPIPPDLRAQLREAGKALAAEPSATRADALLRLAHRAVYGADDSNTTLESSETPAGGVSGDWWSDIPAEAEKPLAAPQNASAGLLAFATEAYAALVAAEHDPADEGEAAPQADWWAA